MTELYVEEEIFFSGSLHLFCKGRTEIYVDLVLQLGQARRHLNSCK